MNTNDAKHVRIMHLETKEIIFDHHFENEVYAFRLSIDEDILLVDFGTRIDGIRFPSGAVVFSHFPGTTSWLPSSWLIHHNNYLVYADMQVLSDPITGDDVFEPFIQVLTIKVENNTTILTPLPTLFLPINWRMFSSPKVCI
jgi:hypothetical protein